MRKIVLIILFTTIYFDKVKAQGKTEFQIWSDFTASYKLSEKWKVGGDIGYRIEPYTYDQTVYIRPRVNYKPNRIVNFILGIANFNTWKPDEFNSIEFRTFQFMQLSWPRIGDFQFKHRLGLEQRLFSLTILIWINLFIAHVTI